MSDAGASSPKPASRSRAGDPPPHYEAHVFVCANKRPDGHPRGCCADKGSEALRNYMKARCKELGLTTLRINQSGCLERCEFGPAMVIYPEGVWYRPTSNADVEEIIQRHLIAGGRVARLMLTEKDVVPKAGPAPAAAS
ncbi:MAG: (2Fe-2S) ferredoxin domain-containing protein [Alphaproteobacteria bacterium]|nr:(2Fe-2S) ferredoxin domain-containing protein [Alphaproteobacteria bacterium]